MKVILLTDVKKQGKKDDIINVSDGYAENFLFKNKLAVPYNTQNKNKLERDLKSREEEEQENIKSANELKNKLANVTVKFKAKCGKDGKMFGSISNKQIEEELKKLGYNIDKKQIECDHNIDSLGIHIVDINLHKKVKARINVSVE